MGRGISERRFKADFFEYPLVAIPEDGRWKKIAVLTIPLFGAIVGVNAVNQMEDRLKAVPAWNRPLSLSLAKVIQEYHGAISLNTFVYGTVAFGCSYGVSSLVLLHFGAIQILGSFYQDQLKRAAQQRVEQLSYHR